MEEYISTYQKEDLPETLPIFPLGGVLLLPRGHLPLNIFEPKYIAMVDEALKSDRLIGMVQPKDNDDETEGDRETFSIGCAGRITSFTETEDGRYLITLTGVSRFKIEEELPKKKGFRQVKPLWSEYYEDLGPDECIDIDRNHLKILLEGYFEMHSLSCDWEAIEGADDEKLITCLSMVCPLEASEKQALLEAKCCRERSKLFLTMLEMALYENKEECAAHH
jgi:Lon protease-like protein